MAFLDFTTSGHMVITLRDAVFGDVLVDPDSDPNVKTFGVGPDRLEIAVHDMKQFSTMGRVRIRDIGRAGGRMTVWVNTTTPLWYATAQFRLHYESGQHVVSDNFQSGVGGDPNSAKTKWYNIVDFRG